MQEGLSFGYYPTQQQCNSHKVQGVTVKYLPERGFTGSDEVGLEVISEWGNEVLHTYEITVKATAPAGASTATAPASAPPASSEATTAPASADTATAPANAGPATAPANAGPATLPPVRFNRIATTGNTLIIGTFANTNPDCTATGRTFVRVSRNPNHGIVAMREGLVFSSFSKRPECNSHKTQGATVEYTPNRGFTGSDEVELDVISQTGFETSVTYAITVK
jgi:hypothetical protein